MACNNGNPGQCAACYKGAFPAKRGGPKLRQEGVDIPRETWYTKRKKAESQAFKNAIAHKAYHKAKAKWLGPRIGKTPS